MSSPLDRLLGSWRLTMHHSQMSEPVHGRLKYERVLDGAFVALDWVYEHPDFPDASAMLDDTHFHYFDVRGVIRVFDFEIDETGWRMTWIASGFSQRSTAQFVGDDSIAVEGERSTDEGAIWEHDFRMDLQRA